MNNTPLPGSFRDPSGFVYCEGGSIYRQINVIYRENYDLLMKSGLYQSLVNSDLLIPHAEVGEKFFKNEEAYKTVKPEVVPFISYPYEWCFNQLKDAALATLRVQNTALKFGMSLKDCSGYNIQFRKGKPVFIDTLSFEPLRAGEPWVAYRQFCQHFLAPLALMAHKDIRLNQLLRVHIDGIPLDLASSLLPLRTRFLFSLASHIHLHAKSQKFFSDKTVKKGRYKVSHLSRLGMIDSLNSAVRKLRLKPQKTEWRDYYEDTNYTSDAFTHKKRLISEFVETMGPKNVWDLGANTGLFSRIPGRKGIPTVSFDIDPVAVNENYLQCVKDGETHVLPLLLDLTNPSPNMGWENRERMSLLDRGPVDMVVALALIHHLAISNNLPLGRIAEFLNGICRSLIIEFVPKNDSMVQRLLSTREDIFRDYNQEMFERAFKKFFTIQNSCRVSGSERTLYLMKKI